MAFCGHCGKAIAEAAIACPSCGHPTGARAPGGGGSGSTDGSAIGALILGILGIVSCPGVLSIPAIILGKKSLAVIEGDPSRGGEGMARAAIVLGWIGVGLFVLAAFIIAAVVFFGEATTTYTY